MKIKRLAITLATVLASTSNAWADTPAAPSGSPINGFIMLAVFIAMMYFLILRPQTKRAKEQRQLMSSITKGDEVITSGGLLGKIVKIEDQIVSLDLNDKMQVQLQKSAIISIMPKGTLKNITA